MSVLWKPHFRNRSGYELSKLSMHFFKLEPEILICLPLHNWLWRVWNYGKKIRSFLYKNMLFHRGKQDPKWSSGVPYCSLLLIWWKDRKSSKKNNEIVSLRSNPQDKEHFCLPNNKTGLKPCGFASRKVVWQKSVQHSQLYWDHRVSHV